MGADASGDQAESQREPPAQADQLGDRALRTGATALTDRGDQQGAGFGVAQYVEEDGVGAVTVSKAGSR